MKKDYRDILYREHPQSPHRPPMPLRERAAQFSPFAALSGYEAVLAECARYTETRPELAGDEQALLNEKLRQLAALGPGTEIHLRYFCPDPRKPGGSIREYEGLLRRLDGQEHCLLLADGTQIPLEDLLAVDSPLLPDAR